MASEQKVEISLNDIVKCINIIDVSCNRGAIKGTELTVVGALRDKFSLFVDQTKADNKTQAIKNNE